MAYVGFNPQNIPVPPYYNQPHYYPPMPTPPVPGETTPVDPQDDTEPGVTPTVPPMPPFPPGPPVPPMPPRPPHPPVPPMPPYGPHGKLPNDGFLINYDGIQSDTADVIVDNRNRTIKVDVNKQGVDTTFVYSTPVPMASWEIQHNLNKYPSVTLTDWHGRMILGEVCYVDKNNVVVHLSEPICGRAYLN